MITALNSNPLFTLLALIVNFYMFVLLLRLLLQMFHGPYYNPISQFLVKVTSPLLNPLQRFIPVFHGIDIAIIVVALVIEMLLTTLFLWFKFSAIANPAGIFLLAAATLGDKIINILFFAIIIDAIVSWIPALQTSPITPIANCIASPLLNWIRRFLPYLGGIDFSPLVALLLLKATSIVILYPLANIGVGLALQSVNSVGV